MSEETMTPGQKIEFVATQIMDIRNGHTDSIACPYCHKFAHRGQLCCSTLGRCLHAVLEQERVLMEIRLQEAIGDALVH